MMKHKIALFCPVAGPGPSQDHFYLHVLHHNVLMRDQSIHSIMAALPPILRGSQVE